MDRVFDARYTDTSDLTKQMIVKCYGDGEPRSPCRACAAIIEFVWHEEKGFRPDDATIVFDDQLSLTELFEQFERSMGNWVVAKQLLEYREQFVHAGSGHGLRLFYCMESFQLIPDEMLAVTVTDELLLKCRERIDTSRTEVASFWRVERSSESTPDRSVFWLCYYEGSIFTQGQYRRLGYVRFVVESEAILKGTMQIVLCASFTFDMLFEALARSNAMKALNKGLTEVLHELHPRFVHVGQKHDVAFYYIPSEGMRHPRPEDTNNEQFDTFFRKCRRTLDAPVLLPITT